MRTTSIPITLINLQDDGFHLLVEIAVFGLKLFAVIDTGASRSVFDKAFLLKHLPGTPQVEETQATTLFTTSNTLQANIPRFKIGRLTIVNYQTVGLDLESVNQAYAGLGHPPVVGIIGSDLLLKYHAVINYKKQKLFLYTQ